VTTARCEWPNGNLELEDGTTIPNGCQEPAEFRLEGGNFCADHAGRCFEDEQDINDVIL
jgi:hypothetical protein